MAGENIYGRQRKDDIRALVAAERRQIGREYSAVDGNSASAPTVAHQPVRSEHGTVSTAPPLARAVASTAIASGGRQRRHHHGIRSLMTGDDPADSSLDSMLNALSNRYRRRVLVALLDHNPQDDDDPQIPDDLRIEDEDIEGLMVHMHHTHLPNLAESGFIVWDQETNTVKKGPQFEEIQPLLELMRDHADELPDDWL